jgi:type IV pilus assembly protein PilE
VKRHRTAGMRAGNAGFTLIEILIAVVLVAILAAIAYPSYRDYVVRSSRAAAQAELLELSSVQEKIYLNSNAYSADVAGTYNGNANGGLGKTGGTSADGKYALALAVAGQSYTLTATPVAGTTQEGDGAFAIASDGSRTCVAPAPKWCANATW